MVCCFYCMVEFHRVSSVSYGFTVHPLFLLLYPGLRRLRQYGLQSFKLYFVLLDWVVSIYGSFDIFGLKLRCKMPMPCIEVQSGRHWINKDKAHDTSPYEGDNCSWGKAINTFINTTLVLVTLNWTVWEQPIIQTVQHHQGSGISTVNPIFSNGTVQEG